MSVRQKIRDRVSRPERHDPERHPNAQAGTRTRWIDFFRNAGIELDSWRAASAARVEQALALDQGRDFTEEDLDALGYTDAELVVLADDLQAEINEQGLDLPSAEELLAAGWVRAPEEPESSASTTEPAAAEDSSV